MAMTADRTEWVDVAKALSIVLVVTMHATLGYQKALGQLGFLDPLVAFFTPFRIPAFFVLSGLFLGQALKRSFRQFAETRLLHFAYFYMLWLVIHLLSRDGLALAADPVALATALGWAVIEPYGPLWFLHLLAVFSALAYACRRMSPLLPLAVAAALNVARVETGSTLVDEFAGRAVYFAAGWAMAPLFFATARFALDRKRTAALLAASFVLVNGALVFLTQASSWPFVGLALGLCGALAMVAASAWLAQAPKVGPLLASFGRRTLVVYVACLLPMAALRVLLLRHGLLADGWIAIGLGSAAIVAAGVATPLLLARVVANTPLAFLFEMPGRRAATPQPGAAPAAMLRA